jgi:hypothetical protein
LYDKNNSYIREWLKNKEKLHSSFSVAPQIANITATELDKVLMNWKRP